MQPLSKQQLSLYQNIATMGYVGYMPYPGTAASFVTLLVGYPIVFLMGIPVSLFLCLLVLSLGSLSCAVLMKIRPHLKDPRDYVIDECAGQLIVILGIMMLQFSSLSSQMVGFLLFRFFDGIKPWPICLINNWRPTSPGLKSIALMFDDVLAALASLVVLYFIYA